MANKKAKRWGINPFTSLFMYKDLPAFQNRPGYTPLKYFQKESNRQAEKPAESNSCLFVGQQLYIDLKVDILANYRNAPVEVLVPGYPEIEAID